MYTIHYNSNPQNPKHLNHQGAFSQLTEQDSRDFDDLNLAVNFWYQCYKPITSLLEFIEDFKKQYNNTSEEELTTLLTFVDTREEDNSTEEYLINQKPLYELED
jgi:hypothetical protein